MKTSTSICPDDYLVRCANCERWIKAGSTVVTTVMPGRVTISHDECPLAQPTDAEQLAERVARFSRNRQESSGA